MPTSGTADFNPQIHEIAEEAFERCGLEMRSGYDLRTARRSLNIMAQEWSNRGINLWTVEQGTQVLTAGTATYVLPADTIDILEAVIRTNAGDSSRQVDYVIDQISTYTYAQIPNKLLQGRPIQLYIERLATPQFTVWPVPDGVETYTVVYWRMRRIEDTGDGGSNTYDVPSRFIPALIAGLAYHIAMKKPEAMNRVAMLKAMYDEQWTFATNEDRQRTTVRLTPRVGRPSRG